MVGSAAAAAGRLPFWLCNVISESPLQKSVCKTRTGREAGAEAMVEVVLLCWSCVRN
jgi:hypothetical protein